MHFRLAVLSVGGFQSCVWRGAFEGYDYGDDEVLTEAKGNVWFYFFGAVTHNLSCINFVVIVDSVSCRYYGSSLRKLVSLATSG